jgi:CHASE3 domain sensor protein
LRSRQIGFGPGRVEKLAVGTKPDITMQIRNFLTVILAVSALLMLLTGILSTQSLGELENTRAFSRKGREAQLHTVQMEANILDAQAGVRGYMLSKNPDYLNTFKSARISLWQNEALLGGMVEDNPSEKAAVADLTIAMGAKMQDLEKMVDLADQGSLPQAVDLMNSAHKRRFMSIIRDKIAHLENIQRDDIKQRSADISEKFAILTRYIQFDAAASFIVILTSVFLIRFGTKFLDKTTDD